MSKVSSGSLTVGKGTGEIGTLAAAHSALSACQPASGSSAAVWSQFYRQASRVYAAVAEVDRGHHHEALHYWSVHTREIADLIDATGKAPQVRFNFN